MTTLSRNARDLLIRIDTDARHNRKTEANTGSVTGRVARQELNGAGFISTESTPGGRKSWLALTAAGRAALPAARKAQERLKQQRDDETAAAVQAQWEKDYARAVRAIAEVTSELLPGTRLHDALACAVARLIGDARDNAI